MEWLRVNDAARRDIRERKLGGLVAQPSLAESVKALVQTGLTNQAEAERVLGFQ